MMAWGELRNYETVLCVSCSPLLPYSYVFLVDLIGFVLFLINPVKCNGGVIDLNLTPTLYRFRAVRCPPARLTPAIGLI